MKGGVILFVGRSLYILGLLFVFFSIIILVMLLFSNNGNPLMPLVALLNGFMAMGIGDIVIDLNHKKSIEKKK
ncbi:hypothetical protein CR203_14825 [Salipaludibacillus neizhouensis]|uniref:Uncharacterized protein n=1 Tax=Salipaludibacillus neizhouensis TaxID=885475 RepID=A0A3A9K2J2_9BACI|nr:hypothetical protein [Salipaludibacillus neizhouensis]RKL66559.1 hypothetical protein CR203_14825 [Salipaludibacillus neizhouensis]